MVCCSLCPTSRGAMRRVEEYGPKWWAESTKAKKVQKIQSRGNDKQEYTMSKGPINQIIATSMFF
jgi:hypothetical protein